MRKGFVVGGAAITAGIVGVGVIAYKKHLDQNRDKPWFVLPYWLDIQVSNVVGGVYDKFFDRPSVDLGLITPESRSAFLADPLKHITPS